MSGRLYFLLIIQKLGIFQSVIYSLKLRKTFQAGSCTEIMLCLVFHHGIYHLVFDFFPPVTVVSSFAKILILELLHRTFSKRFLVLLIPGI